MKKILINIIAFIVVLLNTNTHLFSFSLSNYKENTNIESNTTYIVKLNNGDVISGNIIAIVSTITDFNAILNKETNIDSFVPFIIVKFFDEEIIIYEDEIIDIKVRKVVENVFQYQNHSLFLMPTANPISNNHYIGNYELFFIMGGVGISDYVSLIGGYSFIPPFTAASDQIALVNAKISIPYINVKKNNDLCFAFGYNYGHINTHNKMHHLYGIGTYNFKDDYNPTNISAGIFYKIGDQKFPEWARLLDRSFLFNYPDGGFGLCGGFERHFSSRKDLSLILEIWNADVGNASDTGILLGFRLAGSKVYADFGLSVITTPFAAPFFSFVWMPFSK